MVQRRQEQKKRSKCTTMIARSGTQQLSQFWVGGSFPLGPLGGKRCHSKPWKSSNMLLTVGGHGLCRVVVKLKTSPFGAQRGQGAPLKGSSPRMDQQEPVFAQDGGGAPMVPLIASLFVKTTSDRCSSFLNVGFRAALTMGNVTIAFSASGLRLGRHRAVFRGGWYLLSRFAGKTSVIEKRVGAAEAVWIAPYGVWGPLVDRDPGRSCKARAKLFILPCVSPWASPASRIFSRALVLYLTIGFRKSMRARFVAGGFMTAHSNGVRVGAAHLPAHPPRMEGL